MPVTGDARVSTAMSIGYDLCASASGWIAYPVTAIVAGSVNASWSKVTARLWGEKPSSSSQLTQCAAVRACTGDSSDRLHETSYAPGSSTGSNSSSSAPTLG